MVHAAFQTPLVVQETAAAEGSYLPNGDGWWWRGARQSGLRYKLGYIFS